MWGAGGAFSLSSAIEDTTEAVRFLRDTAIATKYRIDLRRLVLIGHSFGGFLAGYEGSRNADLAAIAMLGRRPARPSCVDRHGRQSEPC